MKLEKSFLVIAIIAVLIAIPFSFAISNHVEQLRIERSENKSLKLHIDSVQKKLSDEQEAAKKVEAEKAELEKKNQDLQNQLQAKLEKQKQQAASTPVVASSGPNCDAALQLIKQYDWNQSDAYKIMVGESGCNPNTSNMADNHMDWAGCMGSFGLFQINCSHGQVFDAAKNVAIAYSKYMANGRKFCTTSGWINTCKKVGVTQ